MTAKELINLLSQYPPETRVVVAGYEGGFNDISSVREIRLKLDASTHWWDGQHDDVRESEPGEAAVSLEGKNEIQDDWYPKTK